MYLIKNLKTPKTKSTIGGFRFWLGKNECQVNESLPDQINKATLD